MRTRKFIRTGIVLLVVCAIAWPSFQWFVSRVEVEPDTFLVVTHRWGQQLPDGELVAPGGDYQGIQRRVLPEGRHFLNPLLYSYEVHKVTRVPAKFCAVLIRKSGSEIDPERKAAGDFLSRGELDLDANEAPGERGIVEHVLGPGKYRLNPYVYDVEIVPAVEIDSQQVGVKVLHWGRPPAQNRTSPYVVNDGERGVQKSYVPGGTHYINPYVASIIPVDVRSHTVVFEDIAFPSRDGFTIEPRVQVRYKVVPDKAPEIFVMLSEDGKLKQADETVEDQARNPILQKIILPLIRGYVRIEGSKHDAREYISKPKEEDVVGIMPKNPRERLQVELMDKVRPECEKVGVIVDYIAVGQPELNSTLKELASQIREREQARIARNTNSQKVIQLDQEKQLKSTEALASQRGLVIDINTKLARAKIDAERQLENKKVQLEADLESAQARLDGSIQRSEAILTKGKADAAVIVAENKAAVAGLQTAIEGFGSAEAFAQYHILLKLSPVLTEVFASDTGEFSKLFSNYLTSSKKKELAPAPRLITDTNSGK